MSMKKAGYSVVIPNINYSNFIHFSKNKLRHEIRLWCFQNLGEWVMCGTGLACHKLIDFFFFLLYIMEWKLQDTLSQHKFLYAKGSIYISRNLTSKSFSFSFLLLNVESNLPHKDNFDILSWYYIYGFLEWDCGFLEPTANLIWDCVGSR